MFDYTQDYTLRKEIIDGLTHYYVSFRDGQGAFRETEVSRPVFLEFRRFVKAERNIQRWDERHTEQSEMTDKMLADRSTYIHETAEDVFFDRLRSEQLQRAIKALPVIQRRRFILHHEFGLTYRQIAKIEGCTLQVVARAIARATKKIRNFFN